MSAQQKDLTTTDGGDIPQENKPMESHYGTVFCCVINSGYNNWVLQKHLK